MLVQCDISMLCKDKYPQNGASTGLATILLIVLHSPPKRLGCSRFSCSLVPTSPSYSRIHKQFLIPRPRGNIAKLSFSFAFCINLAIYCCEYKPDCSDYCLENIGPSCLKP